MKKKICVVSGTRADYGILFPVMKAIEASSNLELCLLVTCMHLMHEFGATVKQIQADGFRHFEKIDISYNEDSGQAMANSLGQAVSRFSRYFAKLKPDFVVVMGDRLEMLAAAIAASYLNIALAHIHGGEVSGHVDGLVRHAITKLAHIHFPATNESRKRILKLGEEPWRVFHVGAPALDRILHEDLPSRKELEAKLHLPKACPIALLVQHPVSSQEKAASQQMRSTCEAICALKLITVVIYPNADAGGRRMIQVIKQYENKPYIKAFPSLAHKDFLGLMKIASVFIGNSSSGIIESASFHTPVVNIGIRQQGRQRNKNVIETSYQKNMIIKAVRRALFDKNFRKTLKKCKNIYGDGHASARIVKVLNSMKINAKLLEKKITY
ncbi:MAG: UDP-N-acetylglucosamine 2-epimerase [Candidatus Omnitrophica bacterium]|nr:UDP-N-acetylglucosamine 2-epimerase [Candidatus Omnitrophota bacterium]